MDPRNIRSIALLTVKDDEPWWPQIQQIQKLKGNAVEFTADPSRNDRFSYDMPEPLTGEQIAVLEGDDAP